MAASDPCVSCGAERTFQLGPHPDFPARLLRCTRCGLVQTSAVPAARLANFYAETYREARGETPSETLLTYLRCRADQQRAFVERFVRWGPPRWEGRRVLDVGAGFGLLARALADLGGDVTVVEPDPSAARVLCSDSRLQYFPDLRQVTGGAFDVVLASHVLEHVPDPVAFLKELSLALVPSGLLFIEVPCDDPEVVQATLAQQRRATGHLSFFSRDTLSRTLSRADTLRVIEVARTGPSLSAYLATGELDIEVDAGERGTWLRALMERVGGPS